MDGTPLGVIPASRLRCRPESAESRAAGRRRQIGRLKAARGVLSSVCWTAACSAGHCTHPSIHAEYTSMLLSVHAIWDSASAPTAEHQRRRPRMAYRVLSVLVAEQPRPHSWSRRRAAAAAPCRRRPVQHRKPRKLRHSHRGPRRDAADTRNRGRPRLRPRPRSTGAGHLPGLVGRNGAAVGALLLRAHGDEAAYREYRDRYRAMATSLCFEGHMAWAEAMP